MKTKSLCPRCLTMINAEIIKEENKIFIEKTCEKHGYFKDVYWSDADLYERFKKYSFDGNGVSNPNTNKKKPCPFNCGLCIEHKTATILANIDLTNRCNQKCPICFANAASQKYVYEPTLKDVRKMMKMLSDEKPVRTWSLQFSGGEPTIHPDFIDIVKEARRMNFTQIQVATNGLTLAKDLDFCKKLGKAGVNTIYLQFDSLKPQVYRKIRGFNALPYKIRTLQNCRKSGLHSVVLVPTVVKGLNDRELGEIIKFAINNKDVVRGINFQPVSFAGRIEKNKLVEERITIPDILKTIESKTQGQIRASDFFPVPSVVPLSKYIEKWLKEPQVELTVHPHCGAGTYILADNGKIISIARLFNIEKFFQLLKKGMENTGKTVESRSKKIKTAIDIIESVPSLFNMAEIGKNAVIPSVIFKTILDVIKNGKKKSLLEFHRHFIFVGVMHFQDPYNFDVERVKRCGIHYATPDRRIIPFCAYNNLYREKIEKRFARPDMGN